MLAIKKARKLIEQNPEDPSLQTLSRLVLALGLLVDDSIVVTENIARHLRSGVPRRRAAMDATSQITVAVLGCTVALVLAFLPLLFIGLQTQRLAQLGRQGDQAAAG